MTQSAANEFDEEVLRQELTSLSLPPSRYPTGWFQIGWSDEITAGEVKLLRYFGTQIVLWRDEIGELHANHPTCMHLGANLGVKGSVRGDRLVCPWHGWEWHADGSNAFIPHSSQTCKPRVRLKKIWQVKEWYGCIIVWHDLLDRDPLWDVPGIDDLDHGNYYPFGSHNRTSWTIKAHPQMVMENGVDAFHIPFIHGAGEVPEIVSAGPTEKDEHVWQSVVTTSYGAGKEETWLTPDGKVDLTLSFVLWGLGLGMASWPAALLGGRMITNPTPIDDTHTELFWCMTVDRGDDTGEAPGQFASKFIEHQRKTVTQDFFTWANMEVLHPPNFAPEEGKHYAALRRWAWQFYPDLEMPRRASSAPRLVSGGDD